MLTPDNNPNTTQTAACHLGSWSVMMIVFLMTFAVPASRGDPARAWNDENVPAAWSAGNENGGEFHSSSLAGRISIVNFWATYCIPCIAEFPTFADLARKYQRNGLSIVGVCVDATSTATLKAFVDRFKLEYPVTMPNAGVLNAFEMADTVPVTFLLDQNGKIISKHTGYVKKEEIEKEIQNLLNLR